MESNMVTAKTGRTAVGLTMCGLVLGSLLAGCDGGNDGQSETAVTPANVESGVRGRESGVGTPDTRHQTLDTFYDAIVPEPPDDQWLPEVTKTGKSVGKLYEAVVKEWGNVPLVTAQGKKLAYTATIATDLGTITIELWPELAPNHVRNFVALARAGYYDGLAFDRVIKREEGSGETFESVEAGCPVGTGEPNYGSIGYWLKPEFNTKATHEPGTIGAWHGEEVASAACKFYISLSKAEWMDGSFTLFGKVTQGLEVVRAIHGRPVQGGASSDRPVVPVVIRSVAVSSAVKE